MAISVGAKAPDFTVKCAGPDGIVDVTLSSHQGKDNVVLLFFPAAFTHVCQDELCGVSAGVHELPNAVVYGVSPDTAFAQRAWAKAENITVPLLSDYQRFITNAYDVVLADLAGHGPSTARATVIIDKSGTVIYSKVVPTLELPDFAEIKGVLNGL